MVLVSASESTKAIGSSIQISYKNCKEYIVCNRPTLAAFKYVLYPPGMAAQCLETLGPIYTVIGLVQRFNVCFCRGFYTALCCIFKVLFFALGALFFFPVRFLCHIHLFTRVFDAVCF